MVNQQNYEQFVHVYGPTSFVVFSVLAVLYLFKHIFTVLPIPQMTIRLNLLLFDSFPILVFVAFLTNFYYKNPYLRTYVWRKVMNSSSVQPQSDHIDIELQSI